MIDLIFLGMELDTKKEIKYVPVGRKRKRVITGRKEGKGKEG